MPQAARTDSPRPVVAPAVAPAVPRARGMGWGRLRALAACQKDRSPQKDQLAAAAAAAEQPAAKPEAETTGVVSTALDCQ